MSFESLKSLFAYKAWANAELFTVLSSIPREQSNHLHLCLRTLHHAYIVDRIFRAHLAGEQNTFAATSSTETPELDALAANVADTDRWYQSHVEQTSSKTLTDIVSFTFTSGNAGRMSREEILLHIVTHGVYHRGQVAQVLKSISVVPPDDPYTVFLHQIEPGRNSVEGTR